MEACSEVVGQSWLRSIIFWTSLAVFRACVATILSMSGLLHVWAKCPVCPHAPHVRGFSLGAYGRSRFLPLQHSRYNTKTENAMTGRQMHVNIVNGKYRFIVTIEHYCDNKFREFSVNFIVTIIATSWRYNQLPRLSALDDPPAVLGAAHAEMFLAKTDASPMSLHQQLRDVLAPQGIAAVEEYSPTFVVCFLRRVHPSFSLFICIVPIYYCHNN